MYKTVHTANQISPQYVKCKENKKSITPKHPTPQLSIPLVGSLRLLPDRGSTWELEWRLTFELLQLAIPLHYCNCTTGSDPCCFDGCVDDGESLSELQAVTHF